MVACKKIFEGKLSIKGARKQQDVMEKKITELDNRLNPDGPGKKISLKTQETLKNLRSDGKNVYVMREDIINEMPNKDYLK